jgi:hypothetical protein
MLGYPLIWALLAFAAAHWSSVLLSPLAVVYKPLGIELRSVKPRVVHPPFGSGEGDLDSDIGSG